LAGELFLELDRYLYIYCTQNDGAIKYLTKKMFDFCFISGPLKQEYATM